MPYIEQDRRRFLEQGADPESAGELNYLLSYHVSKYLYPIASLPRYDDFNEVIGALECAKLELFRAKIGPYEEAKRLQNGNVYP